MVNAIGGSDVAAAIVAAKHNEPAPKQAHRANEPEAEARAISFLQSSVSAPSLTDLVPAKPTDTPAVPALSSAKPASAEQIALQQFDDGLTKLANRPETQAFQLRFGPAQNDGEVNPNAEASPPIQLNKEPGPPAPSKEERAADANRDGKVSEDERRHYLLPLTYRSTEHAVAAQADAPSAFTLTEVNRAYGLVTTSAQAE